MNADGNIGNERVRPANLGEWHFVDAIVTRSIPALTCEFKDGDEAVKKAFLLAEAALVERRRR